MSADLPRILLISDGTLAVTTRAGRQANPTLYNLFEEYPAERIFALYPSGEAHRAPPARPFDSQFKVFSQWPRVRNRLGRFVNPILEAMELGKIALLPPPNRNAIRAFAPELAIIYPITPRGLAIGYRTVRALGIPYILYFMDDWPADSRVHALARRALSDAAAWLMISQELLDELTRRYELPSRPVMIAHNPVELRNKPRPSLDAPARTGTFRIVHAGAIHTMHLDGVLAVAEAIHALRREGHDVELVLHCDPIFWKIYQSHWIRLEVRNGGLVAYDQLDARLKESDLLLVALSFEKEKHHMARSSLLTKVTDYMASGVPMLVCGPEGCACANFVKRWNCGFVCESNEPGMIMQALKKAMARGPENSRLAARGYDVLEQNFTKEKVNPRLYRFIEEVHRGVAGADNHGHEGISQPVDRRDAAATEPAARS